MAEPLYVGNGLAVLIAAVEQARRGRPVTLLTDARAPGGHFVGLQADGSEFDIGMVMLEQHRPAQPCGDLRSYAPAVRNDWTRFGHLAARWLNAQQPLRRVPTPQVLVEGRFHPDYLIADRLDAFVHAEVDAPLPLPREDERHAAHKLRGRAYDTLRYAEAARANHGEALHARYIEPFVRKLAGVGSEDLLARQHRAVWAPLFYPETLRRARDGDAAALAEYPFWTTASGCVATLVRALQDELAAHPRASVVTAPLASLRHDDGGWLAITEDGREWTAPAAVLGLAAERACALLGVPPPAPAPAASVTVLMAGVAAADVGRPMGCLMVVDEDRATCRVTSPDLLAARDVERLRLVAEAHPERLRARHPELEPADALQRELRELLAIRDGAALQVHKCLTARNALVLPTEAGLAAAARTRDAVAAAAPNAWLTGTLLGYGVASFNDQVVQALKIVEELSS